MTDKRAVIGIDIGTTSVKAIAFLIDGSMVVSSQSVYRHYHSQPDYAEQDPFEMRDAVWKVIRSTAAKTSHAGYQIAAISFSAVMHGLFAVNHAGMPLTAMMTWADTRSRSQAERIRQEMSNTLYLRTGTPLHPMLPLAKIMWLRDHHPDLFLPSNRFVSIKEWLMWLLTGKWSIDYSTAAATGMFNLHTLYWDEDALRLTGITSDQLSEPVAVTKQFAIVDSALCDTLLLPASVPVIIGSSDGVLANVGSGVLTNDQLAVTVGTSGAIRTMVQEPWLDPLGRTFCYVLDQTHWVIGGATNSGGITLDWLQKEWTQADQVAVSLEKIFTLAESSSPGANGLLFFPFLNGERAPFWNDQASGVLFGLRLSHQKSDIVRAAIEGIVYTLYSIFQILSTTTTPNTIMASGGFTRSPVWRQLVADVFGIALKTVQNDESSCFGAAFLGFYALGDFSNWEEIQGCNQITNTHEPQQSNTLQYHKHHLQFTELYHLIQPAFIK